MPRKPDGPPCCEVLPAPEDVMQAAAQCGLSVSRHVYYQNASRQGVMLEMWMVLRDGKEVGSWVVKTGSYRAGAVMGRSDDWHAVLLAMAAHGRTA